MEIPSPVTMASLGAALFGGSVDAVIVVHVETGRIVLWNPAAAALFGYPAEEALGMSADLLVPERIRPYHIAGFRRFQDTDRARALAATSGSNLVARLKSGEELAVEGTLSRLQGAAGDGRFLLALFRRSNAGKEG